MTRFVLTLMLLSPAILVGCEKSERTTAVPSVSAPAASETPAPVAVVGHKASGKIEAVDPVAGTLKINHGAVASIGWPAMTMDFAVNDKALLNNLKSGQQIEFDFVERGGNYIVTAIR